jgi:adenylosuccinate lyase
VLTRYTSEAMAKIWSDEARYERWRTVELAVLAAQVHAGAVPARVLTAAAAVPVPSAEDIATVEAEVRHDVVAFLDAWSAPMDDDVAGYVHRHLTSSDTVDTAQGIAIAEATDLIVDAGHRVVRALTRRALEHRDTLCVARTHGQPAALDVVGHRFADFAFAVDRALRHLSSARDGVAVVNVSGPVGTGVALPPDLVHHVADALDLTTPQTTTQVVFRDATATWVAALAVLGAVCEAVATDMRLGQHDGVTELFEPRTRTQQGSSAMPHKRNPVTAENLVGIARLLRGYVGPALENVALWQHRDISHSSVERVVLPDAASLCEYALISTARMVDGLAIDESAVRANIDRAGSSLVSSHLQAQAQGEGLRRRDAAEAVRERIARGDVPRSMLEMVGAEVLASPALIAVFEDVAALQDRYSG